MGVYDFRKGKAIEAQYRKEWLALDPTLKDESGIYFLTRIDEHGFKYAYIGQAGGYRTDEHGNRVEVKQGVLTRLVQHRTGYNQHIDLSLKSHKLYDVEKNPYGWKVGWKPVSRMALDELEQRYIKLYADNGYQLRNVSLGGQNQGRDMINATKPPRTYTEGKYEGKKQLAKELSNIIEKHLIVAIKPEKSNNKISQRQLDKFWELLNEETYK